MPSKLLTDQYIKTLKASQKQYEIFDSRISGFSIRVSQGEKKQFNFVYRYMGRNKRCRIGSYPEVSLADARTQAAELRARVARGEDPQFSKKSLVDQFKKTGFADRARVYCETECASYSERWKKEVERILTVEFVPRWGDVPIGQITKGMIRTVLGQIKAEKGPSASEHAFSVIRRAFNCWVEFELLDSSPCIGLKPPGKSKRRQRWLDDNEVRLIWRASGHLSLHQQAVVKFSLTTAGRREEVAGLPWSELDLKNRIWRLPAERNKSGRDHIVPLSDLAMEIITRVPKLHHTFVFPAVGSDSSMSGFSKWKKKLEKLSGVEGWCLHDLRRTVATNLGALEIAPHVIELVLNHQDPAMNSLARTYNTYSYEVEKRQALQKWGEHLRAIISDERCSQALGIEWGGALSEDGHAG